MQWSRDVHTVAGRFATGHKDWLWIGHFFRTSHTTLRCLRQFTVSEREWKPPTTCAPNQPARNKRSGDGISRPIETPCCEFLYVSHASRNNNCAYTLHVKNAISQTARDCESTTTDRWWQETPTECKAAGMADLLTEERTEFRPKLFSETSQPVLHEYWNQPGARFHGN